MMMAGAALGIIGAIGQYAAQKQATDDYNQQAAIAHRDAQIAATNKYKDVGSQTVWNIKDLNQKGYKAALNAREEQAKGIASSGASGIAYGSNTLDNLMAQSSQINAENQANITAKRDEQLAAYGNQTQSIQAEAQGRIDSVPFKRGPSPLGMILGIANSVVGMGGGGGGGMSGFFGSTNSMPGVGMSFG
jgi:hypothetical protein